MTGGGIAGAVGIFVWVMVAAVLLAALCVIVAQNLFDGHGGFEPTLRVVCYAAAPLVLLWVPVVGGMTLVYAGYLALRGWRTWRGLKGGCSGGCACAKSETKPTLTIIETEKLMLRQRPAASTSRRSRGFSPSGSRRSAFLHGG